jgi:AcrR family transcriptional regulator
MQQLSRYNRVMRMGTKRPGGRSADNLARIMAATADLLVEKGYGRLTTEEVAERAGVHRSTVHRRFPTRAELVAQMMTSLAAERVPVPDTGRLESDLLAFARAVRRATAEPVAGAITRAVVAEGGDRTELGAVSAAFWARRWEAAGDIVRRAIARGELPPATDHRLLVELVVAPIHFRTFITGDAVTDDLLAEVVATVVGNAGPPSV